MSATSRDELQQKIDHWCILCIMLSLHCLFVDFNLTVPILTTGCHYEGMLKAANCRWGVGASGSRINCFLFFGLGRIHGVMMDFAGVVFHVLLYQLALLHTRRFFF